MSATDDKYYLTEVDKYPESIYCMHDAMGENDISIHAHHKGQFLYTEGGIVHVETPQKTYFLPARHYMWIPPGILHSIHPGSADVIMRNLYFPVEKDDKPFYEVTGIYPVNDLLLQMVIFSNRWSGDLNRDDKSAHLFALAFKHILPEVSIYNLPLALPYAKHKRLNEIIRFMSTNLQELIIFPELAHQFGFSERSLSRLFHSDLGMSFIQYLTLLRMMLALRLLLEDGMSVKEVAALVGYNSVPTFSTTFYKIVGMRPSDYVKLKTGVLGG
ncbi:AraC family transcriptional regulator [Dyadobacter luteus]|jgi:AraC-like DNA-binding protein|uniref:AraC family transcriptional regulator n=1 Tax=Dyadobacter luteus TaxID=2259619 RepID=A0A3D8YF20_9BACT|nr:AraC family transcriptional regulator [Dyadobacter luteus]REA63178.1 AraC family transcriptional regulator [Dyadobacter luteus]